MIERLKDNRVLNSEDYNRLADDNRRLSDELQQLKALVLLKKSGGVSGSSSPGRRVMITSHAYAEAGNTKRWVYHWIEAEKTGNGYGGWAQKTGGDTGTAYNYIEDLNSTTAPTLGNGVMPANLTGSFALMYVPTGVVVTIFPVSVGSGVEWWFSYENGIDGGCV